MVTAWEEQNIAAVKELLDGVSDAEVHALCVQALRIRHRKHAREVQFAIHDALGRELIPLLVARHNRPPADPESVNRWKEPFISEQMQPWFLGVSDFLSWFVRAGFGEPVSWQDHNVITARLTRLGVEFLKATEDHPLSPGFVDRIHARCPALPREIIVLLVDAQACMERLLLRPAIVLMGVAFETAIEAVADMLVTKSVLPPNVLEQSAARRITSLRNVVDTVLPGGTAPERDDRFAVARAYQFADDLRRRRNDASHTTPRYGFDDLAEAQEFLVSAGRQLPLIWFLAR
jgi:hypothetical protein